MSRLLPVASRVGCIAALFALAGCSQGEPRIPVFPVSGQVQVEGDSPNGAFVVFHSLSKTTPPAKATADAQGRFKLSTYDSGDGAPAGEYAVTVELRKLVTKDGSTQAGPNVLPEKFSNPGTTPLKVTISAGPNDLAPLVVKKS